MRSREALERAKQFVATVNDIEISQLANERAKKRLEDSIAKLVESNKANFEQLDIASHAIEILREVSDEAVTQAYEFLEGRLNSTLERMFENTVRKIKLKEYTRSGQYPQLEIELTVGNGKVRSLKTDSGHGLAQIVSLLSVLSLIVLTGSRRILVMDEIISGLSVHNRKIVSDLLWAFTDIGFQFIVNEHGFVPAGSKVYYLEMIGDVSHVKQEYIEQSGVYLNGTMGEDIEANENKHAKTIMDTLTGSSNAAKNVEEATESTDDVLVV